MGMVRQARKPIWESGLRRERRYYTVEVEEKEEQDALRNASSPDEEPGAAPHCRTVRELRAVRQYFVDLHGPGGDGIRFRVNLLRDGSVTFSDPRERMTGVAGTTGIWGTLPPARMARPRSLTPTAFKMEAARLIGIEGADELWRSIAKWVMEQSGGRRQGSRP